MVPYAVDAQKVTPKKTASSTDELTQKEESELRKAVYDQQHATSNAISGPFMGHRIMALNKTAIAIHKTKPIATLKLLREIAKWANPDDAAAATGYAVGLRKALSFPHEIVMSCPTESFRSLLSRAAKAPDPRW